jgi:hypothetical protein
MTQTDRIRRHLERGKSITPLEALSRYGCFRLGARIWDLRREGMAILSERVTRKGKTFSSYRVA